MSFAAGPPPNSHSYHNVNGAGRPVNVISGFKHDASPGKTSGKVFKHIEDLVAARPNIDINAPIRKILLAGEAHAKSAESSFDFRRPDLALEEYLKASIITVEIIPRHKDYPELQSDRGELHRLYVGLKKRVSSQQDRFDEAKILIKENNAHNGTQPAICVNPNNRSGDVCPQTDFFDKIGDKGWPSNNVDVEKKNGVGSSILDTSTSRSINQSKSNDEPGLVKRPAIHPKPEALQGRSIKLKTTSSRTTPQSVEDLTTRFARLRGSENKSQPVDLPEVAPIQDPRIKTRPILVPVNTASTTIQSHSRGGSLSSRPNRPLDPRDLPSAPSRPLKIALGVEIPEMPRPPEAVYSPARSLDNNSHVAMQNPSFFNSSLRTLSMDSTKDAGHGFVHDSNPYFYSSPITTSATTKKPRLPDLSTLRSVTAQQLQQFMQIGSQGLSILLVDIRDRENFDNGHIMWHSIICIEPIALREDISADDLEQSLVISPDTEQRLYTQRQDFSLLVYYDQSTSSSSSFQSPRYISDKALSTFNKAVYEYSYDKPLQNRPLLLEGGLDAWVDLIGVGALATSKSAVAKKANGQNVTSSMPPARAAPEPRSGTASLAGESQGHSNNKSRSQEYFASGPIAQRNDSTDDFYFKTADDFMRRFPAVSDIKESMISPSNQLILASTGPARPPQAFAPGNTMFSRMTSDKSATDNLTPGRGQWGNGHVGLQNKSNLCYMLAAIQALSSVHEIRDFLFRGAWLKNLQPDPSVLSLEEQQFATKTFSNLLMHLWSKDSDKCTFINPRTFVATIHRLHLHERQGARDNDVFGGPNQQDSQEFLGFLIEKLCNETSPPKPPKKPSTSEEENKLEKSLDEAQNVSKASKIAYGLLNPTIRSPIGKLVDHCSMKNHYCQLCRKFTRVFDTAFSHFTVANFPENQSAVTLASLLDFGQAITIPDYRCRYCNTRGGVTLMGTFYVKFPDILIIHLARGKSNLQGLTSKVTAAVAFPENGLDLTNSQPPGGTESSVKYDCFAVISHIGTSLKAGHYITHRRDIVNGRYEAWWEFDDIRVSQSSFARIDPKQAYVLFYRRQGTGVAKYEYDPVVEVYRFYSTPCLFHSIAARRGVDIVLEYFKKLPENIINQSDELLTTGNDSGLLYAPDGMMGWKHISEDREKCNRKARRLLKSANGDVILAIIVSIEYLRPPVDDDPTGMNLTPALSIDLLRPFIDLDKAGNRVVTIKKTSINIRDADGNVLQNRDIVFHLKDFYPKVEWDAGDIPREIPIRIPVEVFLKDVVEHAGQRHWRKLRRDRNISTPTAKAAAAEEKVQARVRDAERKREIEEMEEAKGVDGAKRIRLLDEALANEEIEGWTEASSASEYAPS